MTRPSVSLRFSMQLHSFRSATLLAGLSATALLFHGAQEKSSQPVQQQPAPPALQQRLQPILRARFPASGEPPALPVAGGSFRAAPDLSCFYDRRSYAPAWIGDKGCGRTPTS